MVAPALPVVVARPLAEEAVPEAPGAGQQERAAVEARAAEAAVPSRSRVRLG